MALTVVYSFSAQAEMPAQQQLHLTGRSTDHVSLGGAKLNWWICFISLLDSANVGFYMHWEPSKTLIFPTAESFIKIIKTSTHISVEFCPWLWSGPGSYEAASSGSPEHAHDGDLVSMLPLCSQQWECNTAERKDKSLVTSLVSVWYSRSICAAVDRADGQKRGNAVVQCNRHTSDSARVLDCCS